MNNRNIQAFVIVSVSEILEVIPDYTDEWADNNPDLMKNILFKFGCDTNKPIEIQEGLEHRNRLNKVVTCRRYACHERVDSEWLETRWASPAAKNKATGNRLLQDLNPLAYREE